MREVALSVVVVAYDMGRELPRTLRSLGPRHQVGLEPDDYEIVVVDNGSPVPVPADIGAGLGVDVRVLHVTDALPSPARAANQGIESARGGLVGLIVDGARLASPGLLAGARAGAALAARPVVTAPAWHLGQVPHMRAAEVGYDQAAEDELLAGSGWEDDGYALFAVSTFAGSSWRGIFGPMGESSSLFLPADLWRELGGLDERFALPGGGLVNHDLYHRACSAPDVTLVQVLGEGTFHQFHGGAATSRRFGTEEMREDYRRIVGRDHRPPTNRPIHLGSVPEAYLPHIERSARIALDGFPPPHR